MKGIPMKYSYSKIGKEIINIEKKLQEVENYYNATIEEPNINEVALYLTHRGTRDELISALEQLPKSKLNLINLAALLNLGEINKESKTLNRLGKHLTKFLKGKDKYPKGTSLLLNLIKINYPYRQLTAKLPKGALMSQVTSITYSDPSTLGNTLVDLGQLKKEADKYSKEFKYKRNKLILTTPNNPIIEDAIEQRFLDTVYGIEARKILIEVHNKINRLNLTTNTEWIKYITSAKSSMLVYSALLNYEGEPSNFMSWLLSMDTNVIGNPDERFGLNDLCEIIEFINKPKFNKMCELVELISYWILARPNAPYHCEIPFRILAKVFPSNGLLFRGEPDLTNVGYPLSSYSYSVEVAENFAGLSDSLQYLVQQRFKIGSSPKVLLNNTQVGLDINLLLHNLTNVSVVCYKLLKANMWEQEVVLFNPVSEDITDRTKEY